MELLNVTVISPSILPKFLSHLHDKGYAVASTGVNGPKLATNPPKNIAVLFGNEGKGLPKPLLSLCNHSINIEKGIATSDDINSLNVSVAAGIILHFLSMKST